ncbi:hypothetical protein PUN28_002790 [Cardiocondyla obscurior]|uniref:Secreted protein n=1 Tax=Cardiocondyla obscurior TaxID=286306 RepID=A0AAW2GW21_9HYME
MGYTDETLLSSMLTFACCCRLAFSRNLLSPGLTVSLINRCALSLTRLRVMQVLSQFSHSTVATDSLSFRDELNIYIGDY